MVTRKLCLGFVALFSVLLLLNCISADDPTALLPAAGTDFEAGGTVTVSGDFSTWSGAPLNVSIGPVADPLVEETDIAFPAEGLLSVELVIPLGTVVGSYDLTVTGVTGLLGDLYASPNHIAVINSAPEITIPTDLDLDVSENTIGSITISDKNGHADITSCSITNYGDFAAADFEDMAPDAVSGSDTSVTCDLAFKSDHEPTSADAGEHTIKVKVTDANSAEDEKDISFTVNDYLAITSITTDDKTGGSKTIPGDTVEFKIKVENNLDNIDFEDSDDEDVEGATLVVECSDLDIEEEIEFDIKGGKSLTKTIDVQIPYDATEEDGPYTFTITFSGEDGEGTDHEAIEEETVDVDQEKHDLMVADINLSETKSTCGDTVKLSFKIRNLGLNDEKDTLITVSNSKLGINEKIDTIATLGESETKSYTDVKIEIPRDAYNGDFSIQILAESEDTSDSETILLTLEDCDTELFSTAPTDTTIGPGKEKTLTFSLTNIGTSAQSYELRISGVDDFGTYNLSVEDEDDIDIEAGETKEITLTLTANKDAELKDYEVTIDAYLGSTKIAGETLTYTVTQASWLSGFSVFGGSGESGLTIGILIAVLIIGYLGYQIWMKKPRTDELDELEKGDSKGSGSIIFEDEKGNGKNSKNDKKKPAKKRK